MNNNFLQQELNIANIGIETFAKTLQSQGCNVVKVDWRPPSFCKFEVLQKLSKYEKEISEANNKALERIISGQPVLTDIKYAYEVFPELSKNTIAHAGPPIEWKNMCGPLKGAVLTVIVYEGLAENEEEAEKLILEEKINFMPNHHLGAVGPMTGMISYSMPLFEVLNQTYGNYAYCTFNEGLGKVLRFGAKGSEVINRLKWFETILGPLLKEAVRLAGGINLKVIMAKALAMGDEMHQRNAAASAIFFRTIMPYLAKCAFDSRDIAVATDFIAGNEQFFLNLAMPAAKAIMDPVKNIPYSTVVTAMCRNGTEFGIRVSALGERWFTAPVEMPRGLYFPGFSSEDANPDMGDSAIVETIGVGGFAMGAAPAVVRFLGVASVDEAYRFTYDMQEITVGTNPTMEIPGMNFTGVPTGIDIRKVVETGIQPVINTGIANKKAGVGQVGAGVVFAPIDCFIKALEEFVGELERMV